jgi:hypothetical protein
MSRFGSTVLIAILFIGSVQAQLAPTDPDWKEAEAPPPPVFEVSRLIRFDVSIGSSLDFGIDPQTITLGQDGLVRYVVVASSRSGAMNVMYEAIRCNTGEFKTYARRTADGAWTMVPEPVWRSMQDSMPSRHAYRLARQGVCNGRAPAQTVSEIVRNLKSPPMDNR